MCNVISVKQQQQQFVYDVVFRRFHIVIARLYVIPCLKDWDWLNMQYKSSSQHLSVQQVLLISFIRLVQSETYVGT